MDIFRFHTNPATPTKLEYGEIINGLKSKMWIERYREAGEFELVANVSSGIRELLPIGSIVSHIDTNEPMIVETHSISEDKGQQNDIVVTGRGFETILEQRVVGSNRAFPNVGFVPNYELSAAYSWLQAVLMVNEHINVTSLVDDYDALPFVSVTHDVAGTAMEDARSMSKGDLYSRLIELLEVDNLGIRVVRPQAGSDTSFVIHRGVNRAKEVLFSNDSGEIESADYLWSNKLLKNSALVSGRWVEVRVDNLTDVEYKRRMMFVDASDIDEQFETEPTDTDLLNTIIKMEQRGRAALAAQRNIAISKAEVSKEGTRAKYRVDFNVGDLVTVHGDYSETTARRVTEYVEIEDETGMKSYPTLTMDD